MNKIDKFAEFKALSAEFDEKIEEIEVVLRESETELNSLRKQYEQGLADLIPDKDLKKIEDQIDESRRRIARSSDKLDYAKRAKKQRLAEMLPEVDVYRGMVKAEKEEKFKQAEERLHKAKYQFLVELAEVGQVVREIDSLHETTNLFRRQIGKAPEHYFGFRPNDYLLFNVSPSANGIDSAIRQALGIPEWMVKEAYHGRLPQWIKGASK